MKRRRRDAALPLPQLPFRRDEPVAEHDLRLDVAARLLGVVVRVVDEDAANVFGITESVALYGPSFIRSTSVSPFSRIPRIIVTSGR